MSVRQEIIKEIFLRLRRIKKITGRGSVLVQPGSDGIDVNQVPQVLVFEDEETVTVQSRGIYRKQLPIQIEYFANVRKITEIQELGNRMLEDIVEVLELDERFATNGSISNTENELVDTYFMIRNSIFEMENLTALVIVQYQFVYFEPMLGYQGARC